MSLGISGIFKDEDLDPSAVVRDEELDPETIFGQGVQLGGGPVPEVTPSTKILRGDPLSVVREGEIAPRLSDVPTISAEADIQGPQIELPGVEFSAPQLSVPAAQVPEINLPGVDLPTGDIDLSFPQTPQVAIPEDVPLPDLTPLANQVTSFLGETTETVAEVTQPVAEVAFNVGEEVGQQVGEQAVKTADIVAGATEPAREAISDIIEDTSEFLGDTAEGLAEGTSIRKGDGDGFGEVSLGGGAVLDFSDKLESAFSDVTKGTTLEKTTGEDVFNAVTDPVDFLKGKGTGEAQAFLQKNTRIDTSELVELIKFIDDPANFAVGKGLDKISNVIGRNLPIPGGAAGASAAITELIRGGDVESVSKMAGQAIAMEVAFASANAILPGSGVALRAIMALNLEDDLVNVVSDLATDPLGTIGSAGETVGKTAVGLGESAAKGFGFTAEAIADVYGCNLSTAAFSTHLINRSEFLDFPRFRLKIQRNEFWADKFWSGYVVLTTPLQPILLKSPKLNYCVFYFITRPWLDHMQYKLGKRSFSIKGWSAMQFMRVASLLGYVFKKKKADNLPNFFNDNSIMGVYRKIIREVEAN